MADKIKKLVFDLTSNNKKLKACIWTEEMDLVQEPREIYGDSALFLFFRKTIGDEINLNKNGEWWKLILDTSNPSSKNTAINLINTLVYIKDDSRLEISDEEYLKNVSNSVNELLEISETVFNTIKKSDSPYAKQVISESKKPTNEQSIDAHSFIRNLATREQATWNRQYKMVKVEKEKIVNKTTKKKEEK